jgi:hypothetical protein
VESWGFSQLIIVVLNRSFQFSTPSASQGSDEEAQNVNPNGSARANFFLSMPQQFSTDN